jgi:hypothetical protein
MSSNSVRARLRTIATGRGSERRGEEPDLRARAAQAAEASAAAWEARRKRQSPGGLR